MDRSTLRNIAAVAAHDTLGGARNPVMLTMLATCALLAFVFSSIVGTSWLNAAEAKAFLMIVAIAIAPAYTGSVGLLYVVSEEFERGVPVTLAQAGVTTGQAAVGKLAASLIWTLIAVLVACLAIGCSAEEIAAALALSIPASLPVLLMSLTFGLLADDQMKSSVFAVPIVVCAVVPLLGAMAESLRPVTIAFPTGFAYEASCLISGAPTVLPPAAAVALCAVWTAIAAAAAVWAHRRHARKVANRVNRLQDA
ncbi:MAG TPA: hypothetical protein IAC28_04280 [Candidatus Aphodovivens excrementavium]|nr:hypothetical protein [Candidatus Aphodovivens excrementavium]